MDAGALKGVRSNLPVLLALSANSPGDGMHAELIDARTQQRCIARDAHTCARLKLVEHDRPATLEHPEQDLVRSPGGVRPCLLCTGSRPDLLGHPSSIQGSPFHRALARRIHGAVEARRYR
jgi:hypothetical protein